jgi:hypothetical protein
MPSRPCPTSRKVSRNALSCFTLCAVTLLQRCALLQPFIHFPIDLLDVPDVMLIVSSIEREFPLLSLMSEFQHRRVQPPLDSLLLFASSFPRIAFARLSARIVNVTV